ncbi:MAG: hypothetical protein HZC55_09205 [Verrucomicrobia bacterium]|jgi:hypothetical protein|nr:hypothetical protein [Verrucomicrobiota bacterium]
MQKSILGLSLLSAGIFAAGLLSGHAATPANAPAEKKQKLVRVSTLNTVEANREFQANVQLLQAQRQAAIELNAALEKEKDATKKKELKTQLDTLMAKLNENNATMVKTYGFSLDRNYTMVIERSHIYMLVSDEEAASVEKAEADRAKAEKAKK